LFFWWWERCGDAPNIGDGGLSRWRRRRRRRWVRRRCPGSARAPHKSSLPGTHRLALETEFVHQRLLGHGEYDHGAAAEDEHVSLIAAGTSQQLAATDKLGPVTADQAARWALGAILALLPIAIQKLSVPRGRRCWRRQRRRQPTRSPRRRRWNGCCTRGPCWDGARAKLAGGGAEAGRARDTCDTCHALWALLRRQISNIPLKRVWAYLISDGGFAGPRGNHEAIN